MATSGSVNTSAYEGRYLTLSWSATQSITYNKSTISWTLSANGGSSSWYATGPVTVVIDGTTVYSLSSSNRYNMYKGTVSSGTLDIAHNSDGTRSFNVSISASIFTVATNCTGSQTFTLNAIPRYASISQSLSSKTETSITMDWSSDSTIDRVWYSIDNGAVWYRVGDVNASSGQYTITGLNPNTTYQVRTEVRRKDSQLLSDSAKLDITTYAYPYCSNAPTFTIGDTATLTLFNPLARSCSVTVTAQNGTTILTTTTTGTSVTIPTSSASALYSSIPNASQGTYTVTVVYDGNTASQTGTYKVGAESSPTIGTATYQDGDSSVTAITGNNQKIIPGKSKVQFTASGLSAKNSATVSSASVNVNGTTYPMTLSGSSATVSNIVVNSSESTTAVITVTDSRGLTGTKNVTLDVVEYTVPTVSATAKRRNGFYTATDVTVSSNYLIIGTNAVTIQLKARVVGTSTYTVTQTLSDGANVVNLDNQYPWEIVLTITDSFGGSSTFNLSVGKGIPLFYFDIDKESVSVDKFPEHSNSFEVNGDIYGTSDLFLDVDIYATEGKDYELTQASIEMGWEDLVGIDTGLIDWRTNEDGSIPQGGVPATNSTFNRTLLIEVTPSADYTFTTDGTAVNSTIRIHGYDSSGTWMRQLTTVSWTGTAITRTLTIPSDIYNVRISYPKLNLYGTGLFEA